jgi:hypothetical protein
MDTFSLWILVSYCGNETSVRFHGKSFAAGSKDSAADGAQRGAIGASISASLDIAAVTSGTESTTNCGQSGHRTQDGTGDRAEISERGTARGVV